MMKPFFTYDFFTFNHQSAVVLGSDPNFADRKQYEVETSQEFLNYMKNTVFRIDFIDESVDMTPQAGVRDYIGSARVPLKDLMRVKEFEMEVPIKDEHEVATGSIQVRMALHDAEQRQ